jgi:hypothetical protein
MEAYLHGIRTVMWVVGLGYIARLRATSWILALSDIFEKTVCFVIFLKKRQRILGESFSRAQ